MSFIHYLTIGHLDVDAVKQRQAKAVSPLPAEVVELARAHLAKHQGEIRDNVICCLWYGPGKVPGVQELALRAMRDHGCVVADVNCGKVVSEAEIRR